MASNTEALSTKEIIDRLTTGAEMMKIGFSVPWQVLMEAADRLVTLEQPSTASMPAEQDHSPEVGNMVTSANTDSKATTDELARACNHAGIAYTDFLKIKAYLPVSPNNSPSVNGNDWVKDSPSDERARFEAWLDDPSTKYMIANMQDDEVARFAWQAAIQLRQVPDGYKIVPIEPDDEMFLAASDELQKLNLIDDTNCGADIYKGVTSAIRKAIAAAPLPSNHTEVKNEKG